MADEYVSKNFIEEAVENDLENGRYVLVQTRCPP